MFDLNHLSILKKGQSRSINWENRKGEKGMGGRAASDLGTARKGSPCIPEIKYHVPDPVVLKHLFRFVHQYRCPVIINFFRKLY